MQKKILLILCCLILSEVSMVRAEDVIGSKTLSTDDVGQYVGIMDIYKDLGKDAIDVIDSKTLSIDDVVEYVSIIAMYKGLGKDADLNYKFENIFGIHQEGNVADIYYSYSYLRKIGTSDNSRKKEIQTEKLQIVRLNSGKWFDIKSFKFITKRKR